MDEFNIIERPINVNDKTVERRGISRDFLIRTFSHPDFLEYLRRMSYHAYINLAEAIFAVIDKDGLPILTDLVTSPRMRSIDEADKSLSTRPPIREFDPSDTKGPFQKGKLKAGIKIVIHSHPLEKGEKVDQKLIPSSTDLESWETLRVEAKNNYLVEGILVYNGRDIYLLLLQADPDISQGTDYQSWDESQSPQRLFSLLKDSGIRYTILRKRIKESNFPEEELNKLSQLDVSNK